MHIQHVSSCPTWCDPRVHLDHDDETPEHRTAGLTWKPAAGDTELTVRTIRLDNTGAFGHTGQLLVNLYIEDTESFYPGGRPITIEADLGPADARMLAAALVCEAERVEALQLRVTR
jgi:hypothetical protein